MIQTMTRRGGRVLAAAVALLALAAAPARAEEFLIRYAAIFGPDDSVTKLGYDEIRLE